MLKMYCIKSLHLPFLKYLCLILAALYYIIHTIVLVCICRPAKSLEVFRWQVCV